ncbi:hypothetical protein NC981_24650 [Leptolyngbya sp. DQ-M1]|uniref:hypothetical protein n=1 Tax=Leptolyngbya sp. DQ-M1 TaxID=2933920 RepID=UPI00329A7D9C
MSENRFLGYQIAVVPNSFRAIAVVVYVTLAFDLPGGIVGALLERIGVDRWLEANLVESLNQFQIQIEAEVLRQTVRSGS